MNRSILLAAIALAGFASTAEGAAQADAGVAPSALERGRPIEREMAGAETHHYSLALQAGDFVRIVADQRGVDIVVLVIAPDEAKLAEVDSPNGTNGPEPVDLVAPATGTYRVDIRALDPKSPPGKYSVTLERHLSTEYEGAVEVPANAQFIEYGLAMTGESQVWLDTMSLEVVEPH